MERSDLSQFLLGFGVDGQDFLGGAAERGLLEDVRSATQFGIDGAKIVQLIRQEFALHLAGMVDVLDQFQLTLFNGCNTTEKNVPVKTLNMINKENLY